MRRQAVWLGVLLCVFSSAVFGESNKEKQDKLSEYLSGVTQRGRALYEYDQAAWHGTDAFLALNPDKKDLTHYICKKINNGWTVYFGKWNEKHDRLLVSYEATQIGGSQYKARKYDPPQESSDDLNAMEWAIETALADFGSVTRSYNTAILPAPDNQLFVYLYPGQTVTGIFPLGGDVRYTISADGKKIVEKRQLHKTILDMDFKVQQGKEIAAGYHVHILSDVPEDTDVLYVLNRVPQIPEYVGTQHGGIFVINTDGSIAISKK